jgi:uncharacterized protein (TIGR02001 family)
MKRMWAAAVAVTLSISAPAFAQAPAPAPDPAAAPAKTPTGPFGGDITGIVTLANEYSFRGISQTQRNPAVQGGLTYEVPIFKMVSIYGGFWGSNINFATDVNENLELDAVAGVKLKLLNEKLVFDFGYIGYFYPGVNSALKFNYHEIALGVSYDFDFVQVGAKVNWSPNYFANSGSAWYKSAFVTVPLPFVNKWNKDLSAKLTGTIGHQSIARNANFGSPDYLDFTAGITVTAFTIDFTAQVIGTSLKNSECGATNFCKVRPYFSISKSF